METQGIRMCQGTLLIMSVERVTINQHARNIQKDTLGALTPKKSPRYRNTEQQIAAPMVRPISLKVEVFAIPASQDLTRN